MPGINRGLNGVPTEKLVGNMPGALSGKKLGCNIDRDLDWVTSSPISNVKIARIRSNWNNISRAVQPDLDFANSRFGHGSIFRRHLAF